MIIESPQVTVNKVDETLGKYYQFYFIVTFSLLKNTSLHIFLEIINN